MHLTNKQLRKLLNKAWDAGQKYEGCGGRANRMSGKGELRFSNRYQNVTKIIKEMEAKNG